MAKIKRSVGRPKTNFPKEHNNCCLFCGNKTKDENSKTCSLKCHNEGMFAGVVDNSMQGRKHRQSSKDLIEEKLTGKTAWNKDKKLPQFSGENSPLWKFEFSKESTDKMSKSHKERWNNYTKEERERQVKNSIDRMTIEMGRSRWFLVSGIKVQGTYELCYILKLIEEGKPLPKKKHRKWIETPFGKYLPDFDFGNYFVEIKCLYTLKNSKQISKIKWVRENVKKLVIIALRQSTVEKYFRNKNVEIDIYQISKKKKIIWKHQNKTK